MYLAFEAVRLLAKDKASELSQPELAKLTAYKAELVAMGTILAADRPVSTTHVLSSGAAGTMAANGSGLQLATVRNLVLAWVLTLPAAMLISGFLYFVFSNLF